MDNSYNKQAVEDEIAALKAENAALVAAKEEAKKKPFFAEVRERPADREYPSWTFACAGPSLSAWNDGGRKGLLEDGPLVAVNSAIGVCDDADVWLLTKSPMEMDRILVDFGLTVDDVIASGIAVWCAKGLWTKQFERPGRGGDGIRKQFPSRKEPMERDLLGFPTGYEWSRTNPLGGVAIAVSMGAKHIRLFGQDMKGAGYAGIPAGPNSWRDDEDPTMHARWMMDRKTVDRAIQDCAAGGVLLQLGDHVAEVPKRTAPKVPKKKPRAARIDTSGMTAEEKMMLGNPTQGSRKPTQGEQRAIRGATDNMARMAAASKETQ